ncbi:zinc finger MIZ domain-containing protein 2 [Striga asiatica]|uniref:Zinc finger MIZ domain-containing protein 2 n=1 Tax=Striga asiatica TaxID=4170 RepID=A0A5A7QUD4_STRAF|nr:zinc finger MIZ domain-containing protein 2 [Striga asiatica]
MARASLENSVSVSRVAVARLSLWTWISLDDSYSKTVALGLSSSDSFEVFVGPLEKRSLLSGAACFFLLMTTVDSSSSPSPSSVENKDSVEETLIGQAEERISTYQSELLPAWRNHRCRHQLNPRRVDETPNMYINIPQDQIITTLQVHTVITNKKAGNKREK